MGYMTEALKLAINELFDLGYQEVIAGAFSENAASIRVMEKSGMSKITKSDEIEYRGMIHTCVYYRKIQE
jgi:RimJ/RimL family protein N-acetyltransferase